jgi:hypothetical protein
MPFEFFLNVWQCLETDFEYRKAAKQGPKLLEMMTGRLREELGVPLDVEASSEQDEEDVMNENIDPGNENSDPDEGSCT